MRNRGGIYPSRRPSYMVQCPGCGFENLQDALFCSKCGKAISPASLPPQPAPPQEVDQELKKIGESIGREFEKIGKRIEEEARRTGKQVRSVFEETFGLAWPFITSVLGFSILVIVTQVIAAATDGPIWIGIADFVVNYFWLFLGAMMLSDYNGYFLRKYRFNWRWVSPVLTAVAVTIGFWIFARILRIIDINSRQIDLGRLPWLIDLLLPVIFLLALAIGYVISWATAISGDDS